MDTLLVILGTIGVIVGFNIYRNKHNEKVKEQLIEQKGIYGQLLLKHVQGLNFPADARCDVIIYKDHLMFTYQNDQIRLDIKKVQSTSTESTQGNYLLKRMVICYTNLEGQTEYITLIPSYPTDDSVSSKGAVKILSSGLSEFNDSLEQRIREVNGITNIKVTEL